MGQIKALAIEAESLGIDYQGLSIQELQHAIEQRLHSLIPCDCCFAHKPLYQMRRYNSGYMCKDYKPCLEQFWKECA